MGWDDLTGQAEAIATMRAAAADGGMTHSWLITGPPGSGRSILAYAFAAALIARPGDEDVIEDHPGKCRKCGMALVPIRLDSVWTCATRPLLVVSSSGGGDSDWRFPDGACSES